MGVDVQTYRCRIGTFGYGIGSGIPTTEHVMDFTQFSTSIGTVLFIGTLLLMTGIEPNPGPKTDVPDTDSTPEVSQRCPEFVTRPEELKVTAGTSAILKCWMSGEPPHSVVWLKGTTPIKHGKRYKTSSIGDEHYLEILNCGQPDSGQFTCNLSNVAGTASASASVIVEDTCQPTFYSTDLRSQEFLDTNKLSNIESIQSNFLEVSGKRLSSKAIYDPSSKDSKCGTTLTVDQSNNTPQSETEPEFMTVDQSNKTTQSEKKQEFVTVDQSNKTPLCEKESEFLTVDQSNIYSLCETEPEFVAVDQSNKTPLCETESEFVTVDKSNIYSLCETEPEFVAVDQSNKTPLCETETEFVSVDQSNKNMQSETEPEFVKEVDQSNNTPQSKTEPEFVTVDQSNKTPLSATEPKFVTADQFYKNPIIETKPEPMGGDLPSKIPQNETEPEFVRVDQSNKTPQRETEPEFVTVDQSNKTPLCETETKLVTVDQSNKTPLCETEPELVTVDQSNKNPQSETEPELVTVDQSNKTPQSATKPEFVTVDQSNKTLQSEKESEFVTVDQSNKLPQCETEPELVTVDQSNKTPLCETEPELVTVDQSNKTPQSETEPEFVTVKQFNNTMQSEAEPEFMTLDQSNIIQPSETQPEFVTVDQSNNAMQTETEPEFMTVDQSNKTPHGVTEPEFVTGDQSNNTKLKETEPECVTVDQSNKTPQSATKPEFVTVDQSNKTLQSEKESEFVTVDKSNKLPQCETEPELVTVDQSNKTPQSETEPEFVTVNQSNNTMQSETEPEYMTLDQSNIIQPRETEPEFVTVDQSYNTMQSETEPEFMTVDQSKKTPHGVTEPEFVTGDQFNNTKLKETEPECVTVDQSNETLKGGTKPEFSAGDQPNIIPLNENKPEFVRELENQTVSYDSEVILECRVTGTPLPEIYWAFNDVKVKQSKHLQTFYYDKTAVLVIAEAFSKDNGKYTCIAKNPKGTFTTSCKLTVQDQPMEGALRSILEKLKLDNKYPGKIHMSDILSLSIESESKRVSYADIPWTLLRSIILSDSDCRDKTVADILIQLNNESGNDSYDRNDMFRDANDGISISPLDIFYVVIQCCDPLVQSFLYKKFYLCKIAVPFIFWQTNRQQKDMPLWPIRSITIEHERHEISAIQLPTYTVAIARFGRPRFSKSNFLNHFLTENTFKVFYNKKCPLGTVKRLISTDSVETFWSQSENDKVTIFNLRGDISTQLQKADICICSKLVDILIVVVELENVHLLRDELENMLELFNRMVLIVNNPPYKDSREQYDILRSIQDINNIKQMVTFQRDGTKLSPSVLTMRLNDTISEWYNILPVQSLEQRLSQPNLTGHLKDVNDEEIARIENIAVSVAKFFECGSNNDNKRQHYCPASSDISKQIAYKTRKVYKSKVEEAEKIKGDIEELRCKQITIAHSEVQKFAHQLIGFELVDDLQLFLAWVSELLETEQRKILPMLRYANKQEFEVLWELKNQNQSPNTDAIKAQTRKVKDSGDAIEASLFSVTHLISELNHICQARIQCKKVVKGISLQQVEKLLQVFAKLMIRGHPFELRNGNSMYLPIDLINNLFNKVHEKIGREKIFTLSILGLQSSGKSTLLNSMFGSHFAVNVGKCTRGVHIQMLSVSDEHLPFKYVLLIDTEGLRSPELENNNFNHDNELATFVTGLGDTTLVNIMGENMSEISDTLQIMVHAFLRLKLANKRLDIKKKCLFVHHNVSDQTASVQMHKGLQNILTTLDTMTQEAASSEGISDIYQFNQVIDFNIKNNVWYFPNLWKGNPPVASVNKRYSEKARDLRQYILRQAVQAENKSYKTLNDIFVRIDDLWQGVLKENFVFSFRNSLAIKAYSFLQKEFKGIIWKTEQTLVEAVQQKANKMFSKCRSISELNSSYNTFKEEMGIEHTEKGSECRELVSGLFEKDFQEIIAKWKVQTLLDFDKKWESLLIRCEGDLITLYTNRNAELKLECLVTNNEQTLYDKSKAVAKQIKETGRDSEKLIEFEKLWQDFIRDIPTESKKSNIVEIFFENLSECLQTDYAILNDMKTNTHWPKCEQNSKCLIDSLVTLDVEETDLSAVQSIPSHIQQSTDETRKRVLGKVFQPVKNFFGRLWQSKRQGTNGTESNLRQFQVVSNLDLIMPSIQALYTSLDTEIRNKCSTDRTLSEHHVKEFLSKIEMWVDDIKSKKDVIRITLKSTCRVKIYLHASRFTALKFEEHNKLCESKSGIQACLHKKKVDAKVRFLAMVEDRSAEERAILSFTNVIATFVKHHIIFEMRNTVVKILLGQKIPTTKYIFMIHLVTDLVRCGTYDEWYQYLEFPESYAKVWIEKQAKQFLFGKKCEYKTQAIMKLQSTFHNVIKTIHESLLEDSGKPHLWIAEFVRKTSLPIPHDIFNGVVCDFKEIKSLENITDFRNQLIEEIGNNETNSKKEMETLNASDVVWHGSNPYDEIFDRVWGCVEKCPFCRESCAREKLHDGINHYCIQHRIKGCIGIHNLGTGEIVLYSCSYAVQSEDTHTCGVFEYACNDGESPCKIGIHKYKDYKTYFPNWDIAPNPNMDDTSKVWMWFMANFKDDLKDDFIKVDNIPVRWNTITPDEAINSYDALMINT